MSFFFSLFPLFPSAISKLYVLNHRHLIKAPIFLRMLSSPNSNYSHALNLNFAVDLRKMNNLKE